LFLCLAHLVKHTLDELLLLVVTGKFLPHHFFSYGDRKVSDRLAYVAQRVVFFDRYLRLGLLQDFCAFGLRLATRLANDTFCGGLGLAQNLGLTLTRLLQKSFAFLLYACQPLVRLVRLGQRLVNIVLAVLNHFYNYGETVLCKQDEDNEKCQKHPNEQAQVGSQYGWQIY